MAGQKCKCGHEKRDHRVVSAASRGACSICLCDTYQTNTPRPRIVERAIEESAPARPIRNSWIIS
jgi:hypothetical protein